MTIKTPKILPPSSTTQAFSEMLIMSVSSFAVNELTAGTASLFIASTFSMSCGVIGRIITVRSFIDNSSADKIL